MNAPSWGAPHDAWGGARSASGVLTPPVDPTSVSTQRNVFVSFFDGLFGRGDANTDIARDVNAAAGASAPNNQPNNSFYNYHIGDLFTPGTQNFVFEPTTELTPLTTIWGNAFLRRPNTFSVRQPPQSWADYNKFINGIGGLQAGQYAHQPLESIGT